MPSMPGSGTGVPLLPPVEEVDEVELVEPPVVVEPPVDDEVELLVEVEEEVLLLLVLDDELVLPVQPHLQPPDEPPHHENVAEAGVAAKAVVARASAIMDFLIMSNTPMLDKKNG